MKDRSLSTFLIGAVSGAAVILAIVHRRVIKAVLNGDPIPEAPDWHCWVKKDACKEILDDIEDITESV